MNLLKPINIGRLTIPNRMVKSATQESMAGPEGEVTQECITFYRKLARGRVGLIISGNIFHDWAGHNWPHQLGLDHDGLIEGYKKLTTAVHEQNGIIFAQINDTGREAGKLYSRGKGPRGPSAVPHPLFFHIPQAMSKQQIHETISSFARCCNRAKTAGFDGIQIHAAHGYLVNQFLSPYLNRRKDEYGGPIENRWRFIKELIAAVREQIGADYPLIIKVNASDGFPIPWGVQLKEALLTAKMLDESSLDAIEVSCGCYESGMTMIRGPMELRLALQTVREFNSMPAPLRGLIWLAHPLAKKLYRFHENYNIEYAEKIKQVVKMPVISVGGIRNPEDMESFITEGRTDMVSMARPLIAEPGLPARIMEGDLSPSRCVNCNICLMHMQVKGLRCYHGKIPEPHSYFKQAEDAT